MNETVAGREYVEAITSMESDRAARSAFQAAVSQIAKPGAALFDFGAGPGLDARFYAERGFSVAAYDVDPKMRAFFAVYCRDFISAGKIVLGAGSYREFLEGEGVAGAGSFDLITSNFAPLNLIADLHELFAKLHDLTAPNAQILAAVLSPYCASDMRYAWWWRNMRRLRRDGHYSVKGGGGPIIRRRLANYAAQSMPYFRLEQVLPGLPARSNGSPKGIDVNPGGRFAWLHLMGCRYMFLRFRRCDDPRQ